jgi:sugar lactone lactonase YvrE
MAKSESLAATPTSIPPTFGDETVWEHRSVLRNGEFLFPSMLTVDQQGLVYVTDSWRVQVFTLKGEFVRAWGHYGKGDGEFSDPEGIAVNSDGLVYVVDKNWPSVGRVQVFDNKGSFLWSWGNLKDPSGIAIAPDGTVYIIEQGVNQIRIFSANGDSLGSWGTEGTEPGQFDFRNGDPSGIGVDNAGNVYVADMANNRVQKFAPDGKFINQWGTAGSNPGQMSWPIGLAVSNGVVYVVDGENHRIQAFDTDGNYLSGFGQAGNGPGQLGASWINPLGIAVTPNNQIVVVDSDNNRIQVFDKDNSFVRMWGKRAYSNSGELLFPGGVAIAQQGDIYVTDNGHGSLAHFSSDGHFIESWDLSTISYYQGLTIDSTGNFYTFDLNNAQIVKISPDGQILRLWGEQAWPANDGSIPDGKFQCPGDIAILNSQVYATDICINQVQVFDLDGNFVKKWSTQGIIIRIVPDLQGNLLIVDSENQKIQTVSTDGDLLYEWSFSSSGLVSLSSIAVHPNGKIYLSDSENHQIYIFDEKGKFIDKWQLDSKNELKFPERIVFDRDGAAYVIGTFSLIKLQIPPFAR